MPRNSRNRHSQLVVADQQLLGGLQRRFAAFRQAQPAGTRVPESLRRGVLDAVDAGVSATAIGRVCGVTRDQMQRWRRSRRPCGQRQPHGRAAPQVLRVIDNQAPQASTEDVALDVGIGGMRLSIRLCADEAASR
jgi:hypothetical protein